MMRTFICIVIHTFLTFYGHSQSINGVIIDSESGEPIAGVNIYLENSTIGTSSNQNGEFVLNGIDRGMLIISHVSYQAKLVRATTNSMTIQLQPQTNQLDEIAVSERPDKQWKRNLKKFQTLFFGENPWGKACTIENPWVIDFRYERGAFIASSNDLIKVLNKKTGYSLSIYLEKFEQKGDRLTIAARPFFRSIGNKYDQIRENTFLGSKRHFLHALVNGIAKEEGFQLNRVKFDQSSNSFILMKSLRPKDIISDNNLKLAGYVEVRYIHEKMIGNEKTLSSGSASNPFGKVTVSNRETTIPQTSFLLNRKSTVSINEYGLISEPSAIVDFGYWSSYELAGHWLPFDYFPSDYLKRIASRRPERNFPEMGGFILSDLRVPINEIKSGGPGKDGIPAIYQPKFISEKESYADMEPILGLSLNGIQKAYPIKIMNYHEVVNDQFGNQQVLITYCPLCGSGVGFDSKTNGKTLTFGVSGLLYNSDVLLYDHQTESLWSQLESKSISGDHSGAELNIISLTHTTWGAWKSKYPESFILSTETGFKGDYSISPYEKYLETERLMFPIDESNKVLPNKEVVLGIQHNGRFKAYPFSKLKPGLNQDRFENMDILIHYDESTNNAWLSDEISEQVKATRLFWFAWFAFHPETEIYSP